MASKGQKIKDLYPVCNSAYGVKNRFSEYFNLLLNSVSVKHKDGSTFNFAIERFIKNALFDGGAVGYDKVTDKWFYCYGEGVNEIGNPVYLVMVNAKGYSFTKKASYEDEEDGAYKINALPISSLTMRDLISEATDFMTACDVAMRQNLEACKTPYIVVCKDENMRLSFETAIKQKQDGQAVVVVSEDLGEGLKSVSIGVEFLVDKFAEVRNLERDTLLNKIGIMTANIDKKERVQATEVNATLGKTTDYIYLLIDTFNKQCETYGIDAEMVLNASLEEIYLDEDEEVTEPNINEVGRKEETTNDQ